MTAQQNEDDVWVKDIRAAEERHRAAFLAGDLAAIDEMIDHEFVVNSPRNAILVKDQLLELVRNGALAISAFDQQIEHIHRFGDVVTVMGADSVVYAAPSPNAGQTQKRRFTDLWRLVGEKWRLIARQATVPCP